MWAIGSNKTEQACYASTTPVAKSLLFKHDDACILGAGDLLRPCGACCTPAAKIANPPTLLPLKRSTNEDLQDFGRPTKRRIVYNCGAEMILVFPSDIKTDVFMCDIDHAHTWVASFQDITERTDDFIPFKPNFLRYSPKSTGITGNAGSNPGYPPYDPNHGIWASLSGISGMTIDDFSTTGFSSFPMIQTMSIRSDVFEIPSTRIEPDSDSSDGELRAWSDCSEETKQSIFSFHSVDDLDGLSLSPIEYARSASESIISDLEFLTTDSAASNSDNEETMEPTPADTEKTN